MALESTIRPPAEPVRQASSRERLPAGYRALLVIAVLLVGWIVWVRMHHVRADRAAYLLTEAAKKGDVASVRQLLAEGADPNAGTGGRAKSPGLGGMVDSLLLRRPRYAGFSALGLATTRHSGQIVRMLVGAGADPNNGGDTGDPPILTAIAAGDADTVFLLLDRGASLESKSTFQSREQVPIFSQFRAWGTPLAVALQTGHLDLAHRLVERGADVVAERADGSNILMLAARAGDLSLVQACLHAGASPIRPNIRGETPLHFAARGPNVDVARLLLDRGARVQAVNARGSTPLHVACRFGRLETARLLLARGAKADARDDEGCMPHHLLVSLREPRGRPLIDLLAELKARGADMTTRDLGGENALVRSARFADVEVIQWLLEQGVPVGSRGIIGQTALHAIADCGYDASPGVEYLLEHGAEVDARDGQGETPLLRAVRRVGYENSPERRRVVRLLLDHGATPDAVSNYGQSPLAMARRMRAHRPELARMLEDAAESRRALGHNARNS